MPGTLLIAGDLKKQCYRSTSTQNLKEIKKEMFNLFNARTSHFMPKSVKAQISEKKAIIAKKAAEKTSPTKNHQAEL